MDYLALLTRMRESEDKDKVIDEEKTEEKQKA
jgi:hypothetical protein